MEAVSIGRIVHFVMPDGTHRPAIVVAVNDKESVNLQVFFDGENEQTAAHNERLYGTGWRTSVKFTFGKKAVPGTCHWPEGSKKEESEE